MFPMMRMLTRNRSFRISKMAVEMMSWGFRGFIGALRLLCFDHRGRRNRGKLPWRSVFAELGVVTLTSAFLCCDTSYQLIASGTLYLFQPH